MKKFIAATAAFLVVLPLVSLAHPGHGDTDGYTITHYFTEPVHILLSLAVITAVALYVRNLRKKEQRN